MGPVGCNAMWIARIIDVDFAFLHGNFKNGKTMYTEVPDGIEEYYGSQADVALLLHVPIFCTKQAANCFYEALLKEVKEHK